MLLINPFLSLNVLPKKNGFLYFTVPFLQGFHADPNDYRRFTLNGFVDYVGSECVLRGVSSGPFSALSWILRDVMTFGKRNSPLYMTTRLISSLFFVPISYIDFIYPRTEGFARNANEYFFLFKNS